MGIGIMGFRQSSVVAAGCFGVAALTAATAHASDNIFHVFTPSIEAGSWGVEALSAFMVADEDHEPVRAAHELAIHTGINEFWMAKLALGLERPAGGDYDVTSVAFENVFRFYGAHPGALDAAWFTAVSAGIDNEASNAIEFGPVISLSEGPVSLVLNPFFEKTFGDNSEPGIAFSYGWRATYRVAEFFSVGLEGYGTIEDIANKPAFEEQIHRIGPVLYLGHVHGDAQGIHGTEHAGHDDHGNGPEWHGEIGVLLGLTDHTNDAIIKFNVGADF